MGTEESTPKEFRAAASGGGRQPWLVSSKQATELRKGLQKWLNQMLMGQDFPFIYELSPAAAPCLSSRCSMAPDMERLRRLELKETDGVGESDHLHS